jgi:hypothetical protein
MRPARLRLRWPSPDPRCRDEVIAKFADAFAHTPERKPPHKGARTCLDGRPNVIFAAARRQETGALVDTFLGRGPAAVQKTHDSQITLERDQVPSVRLPSQ